jgi:hypothetical protein
LLQALVRELVERDEHESAALARCGRRLEPYKRAWAASQALAWLAFKSGKQFDPDLVVPFIQLIQRQLYRFDAFMNELSAPAPTPAPLAAAA